QKRRKLWSLAARAAVKCPDDAEKAVIDSPSISVPSKDSLVKTQDSGVSVDLQADPMQVTGAFTSFYASTNPVSFDKVFHSLDKHAVGQDPSSFRFPSRYSSSGAVRSALPKISDPFPRPGDVARLGQRPHRRILNPIRRVAGNRVLDSADSSGIGSSLDWASMDVGQPNPGRHLSATLIPPIFPVNIPISTRSFDETFSQRKDMRPFPKLPDNPVTNFVGTAHHSYHRLGLSMDSSPYFRPEEINPRVQLESVDGRVDPLSGYWYTTRRQSRPFSPVLRRTTPQESVGHRMFRSLDQSQVPTEYAPCLTTPRKVHPGVLGPCVDIPLGSGPSMPYNANVSSIQHHAPTYHAKPRWSRDPTASFDTVAAPKLCTRYSTGYLFDPVNRRSFFTRRSRTLDEASVHHTNTVSDCRLHHKKHVMYPVPPPTDEYDLFRSESPFSPWPEKNRSASNAFLLRPQLSTDRLTFRGLDDRQGSPEFTASTAAPMKLEL
ncbi:hypothetical protein X801_06329, partial [Opisthorchis viverrini]